MLATWNRSVNANKKAFRIESEIWKSEYPFQSQTIDLDGYRMHYVDEGPATADQAVVCVHGNPTWSFYYRSLVSRFRSTTRMLAVDHIGCGLSDKPQAYPYTLRQHIQNLVTWIERLDLRNVVMVVHDWGGAIGLGAAVARPDRIAKLLILNTAAFPPPYIPLRIAACRFPLLGSWAIRYLNAFAGAATWMAIDRLPRLSEAARQGLLYPYRSPTDRVAIDGFVRDIPFTRRHANYTVLENLERELAILQSRPTSLVWGMKDWCFRPECLHRLRSHFPAAHVRELSDVGHYVMEEASTEVGDELARLLDLPLS